VSDRPRVLIGSVVDEDEHVTELGHPERPARLQAVRNGIGSTDLDERCLAPLPARDARITELARVHDELYLDALAQLCDAGGGQLDPDTSAAPGSWRTAVRSAGLGLSAVEALRAGDADAAFVAPRPPGHHATALHAMGFCLLNNVAVTAAALAEEGERVLIVDWDVHHGNGTQSIFWNDPRVLFASTHQWPAYPGTGRAAETGGPGAPGLNVNVPLPAHATGDVALAAIDEVVAPAVDAFAPTWVLISAGFDAHRDDPLADLMWSAGDFLALTQRVLEFAPQPGRVIAFLEGGYDLDALAKSAGATVAALAGERWQPENPTNGGPGREAVATALVARARAQEESA
jgi:acetoin utilization deacetylase AcuC-like enzyme